MGTEVPEVQGVSDDEAGAYLSAHPEKFIVPTRFLIRYIAVKPGPTAAERSTAWKHAQEAYDRLVRLNRPPEEAEFSELALSLGADPEGSRPSAWIVAAEAEDIEVMDFREDLTAHPLYNTLQGFQAGDLVGPIEQDGMIYIIQVLEKREEEQLERDYAADYLNAEFALEKAQAMIEEQSRLLRERVALIIYEGNLREMLSGD